MMITPLKTRAFLKVVGLFFFFGILLLAPFSIDQALAARDSGEKRECATCHIMWLKDFKAKDKKTLIPYDPKPTVATGKQDIVSTERMCFSCHDGFVRDSRKSWKKGKHGHPVGMKPSSKITIPTSQNKTIFPLNDDGKVYCGTCHSAHGENWDENEKESSVFMRVRSSESGLCLACHLNKSTGPAEGNHPVYKKLDGPLPEKLKKKGSQTGKGNTVICQTCHVAHGAETKKSHLVMKPGKESLCEVCHKNKKSVADSKHDLRKSNPEAVNKKGETAQESGVCSACHRPHGGNGPALWGRTRMADVDAAAAACLGCHSNDGAAEKKVLTKHNHPVGVSINDLGIDVKDGQWKSQSPLYDSANPSVALPLYDKNGMRVSHGGNVGCGSCHDPHMKSSTRSDKKTKATKEEEKASRTNFLRISKSEGSALCFNCHIKKKAISLSKHNAEIFQPEEQELSDKDEPSAAGDVCATCHQVHHAEAAPLWARKLGPGKAAVESLCSDCHRKEGVAEKKLTGKHSHPLGISADGMSKSGLPLFDKGEAKEGNNIDCATCHDLHQWDPTNALSKEGSMLEVDGDSTNSFLRMTAVSGKLCADCHHDKELIIGTEHDLNVMAPEAVNLEGKKVDESGVCGQCHQIHNASGELYLWARNLGKDDMLISGLCKSCHDDDKPGEQKQPRNSKHPKDIKLWSQELRTRYGKKTDAALPVYNEKGVKSSMGGVACPTCHNVHKWSPGKDKKGPGKNTEGDVSNSFLRVGHSSNMVCADCHGKEALFRYKYFHSPTSHKKYWFSR